MIELTAIYETEHVRFEDGVIVATARPVNGVVGDPISIKGPAEPGELQRCLSYRFCGHWGEYKNKRT
jgi:hypothetical protein